MGGTLALPAEPAWRHRVAQLRDRLLGSPRFRSWAAAFPLTRPIARRRARALFDLCAGFVYAQILYACVELELFDILAEGPLACDGLAQRLSLPTAATERLMAAAIALRLVARRGDRFALGPLGAAMVGNPGVAAMVQHHALLYADLADPVALLRGAPGGTALASYWAYAAATRPAALAGGEVAGYTTLMAVSQPLIAEEILGAYRIDRHRCLLDVGGGDGSFLAAAAARAPDLRLMLFDLPPVIERAQQRLDAAGLGARARAIGGSFLADPLPTGADLITLVRVVHDHDDAAVRVLLRAVHAALPPGGTILLAEPMSGTAGAEPAGDAYFGFYLLAMGSGRPRPPAVFQQLLSAAGFTGVRLLRTRMPMLTRLMVATKSLVEL